MIVELNVTSRIKQKLSSHKTKHLNLLSLIQHRICPPANIKTYFVFYLFFFSGYLFFSFKKYLFCLSRILEVHLFIKYLYSIQYCTFVCIQISYIILFSLSHILYTCLFITYSSGLFGTV